MKHRLFLVITLLLWLAILPVAAQHKSKAVQKLEKERQETLRQIEKTEKELKQIQNDRSKKQKEAKLLGQEVAQRAKLVKNLETEIHVIEGEIDSLARHIQRLQTEEKERTETYARTAVAMQRRGRSVDRLLFLFSSKDFDQAIRRMRFMGKYAEAHRQAAEALRATRAELEVSRRAIEANRQRKSNSLVELQREKKKLERARNAKSGEVKKLQGKEKNLQRQKKKQQQRAAALNKKIEQQIAFEIAEAERKAREEQERREREARRKGQPVPEKEERKAVTKGGYAMTAEERKLSGDFASNRGQLLVPVTGRYSIIGRFGVQQHSQESRVQTNNAGIDIEVPCGTNARASFAGTVTKIFVLPGYHTSVIVRHGNYLTVYANLESVAVHSGQKVKTGQTIGKIANDAESGKCVLHFQVWHERNKLNPEQWIR